MATRYSRYLSAVQLLGDLLVLNLSLCLAFLYKFGNLEQPFLSFLVYFDLAWLVMAAFFKPYKASRITRIFRVLQRYFGYLALHLLFTTAFYVIMQQQAYSRELLLISYLTASVLGFSWKVAYVLLLRYYRKRGFNYRNIVIVGSSRVGRELGQFFKGHPEYGYTLLGYFGRNPEEDNLLGNITDVQAYALDQNVNEIYCCIPTVTNEEIQQLVDFGEENLIKIKLVTDLSGVTYKGLELENYGDFPVIQVTHSPLDDWKNRFIKRTFDILFSSLVLLGFMWWVVPIIAILIKFSSRGPVFFRQMRTGKGNNIFTCYKFRTMRVNAAANEQQATRNDSRVTSIGAFLRKTSLDELPQFLNVLWGDMSVVGPRPHMLKHTEEYGKIIGKYMARHAIKPGITGLAQVKGYRGEIQNRHNLEGRVRFDLFYVEKWSLLFDLQIITETISIIFSKNEQAY